MSALALGIRCEQSGDLEGARDAYRRAMASGESHGGAGLRLLRVLSALDAHEEVLALADILDGKTGVIVNSAAIAIERARALLALERHDEALVAANDAMARLERSGGAVNGPVELSLADALIALAQALRLTGDVDEAIPAACSAAEHSPLRTDAWAEVACALAASGNLEGALGAIGRALEIDPADGALLYDQARYRASDGDRAGALQSLAHAIAIEADYRGLAADDDAFAALRGDPAFEVLTRST